MVNDPHDFPFYPFPSALNIRPEAPLNITASWWPWCWVLPVFQSHGRHISHIWFHLDSRISTTEILILSDFRIPYIVSSAIFYQQFRVSLCQSTWHPWFDIAETCWNQGFESACRARTNQLRATTQPLAGSTNPAPTPVLPVFPLWKWTPTVTGTWMVTWVVEMVSWSGWLGGWMVGWLEFVWVNFETSQARIVCPFMSCQLVLSTTEPVFWAFMSCQLLLSTTEPVFWAFMSCQLLLSTTEPVFWAFMSCQLLLSTTEPVFWAFMSCQLVLSTTEPFFWAFMSCQLLLSTTEPVFWAFMSCCQLLNQFFGLSCHVNYCCQLLNQFFWLSNLWAPTETTGDVSKNNCASCRLEHWYFQGPEGLSVKQGDFHPKTGPFQCWLLRGPGVFSPFSGNENCFRFYVNEWIWLEHQWISVTKVMTPGVTTLLSLEGSEPQEWPRNTKKGGSSILVPTCCWYPSANHPATFEFGSFFGCCVWPEVLALQLGWVCLPCLLVNQTCFFGWPGLGRCLVGPPLRHLLRAVDRRQACADAATPAVAAEAAQHRTPLCGPGNSGADWMFLSMGDIFVFIIESYMFRITR